MHNTLGSISSLPPAHFLEQQGIFPPHDGYSSAILGGSWNSAVVKVFYKYNNELTTAILKCSDEENSAKKELNAYAVRPFNISIA
jgi:RES domain-containing protein